MTAWYRMTTPQAYVVTCHPHRARTTGIWTFPVPDTCSSRLNLLIMLRNRIHLNLDGE